MTRRARRRARAPNLLAVAPRRAVEWEEGEDGLVVLVRRRPRVRSPRSLGRWLSYLMAPPRIRLDELGSFAWRALDGHSTVGEVAERVRDHFGEEAEPVEHRLGQFVVVLRRERFVSYPGLDPETSG